MHCQITKHVCHMHNSQFSVCFTIAQPHVCSLESFDAGRQTKICSGKSLIFTKRDAGNASEHTSAKCVNREKGKREL